MCQAPGPALCTFPQNLRPQNLSVAASWRRGPRPRGQVCRAPGDVYLRGLWMCAGTLGPRRVCACISAAPRGPAQKTPALRCALAWSRGEGRGRAARGQRPGKSGPWGRQRLRGRRGEQEAGGPQALVQGLGWVRGWGSHIYSWGTWGRAPVLTAAPSRPLTAWGAETLLGPHCTRPRGCACAGGVRTPAVGGSASRLPWGCVCRFPQRHGGQRRGPGRGHRPPGARGHSPGARAPEPFQSR